MKIYSFSKTNKISLHNNISSVIKKIAQETQTDDLVTATYLLYGQYQVRGTAYVRHWLTSKEFITRRGNWKCTSNFPIPKDVPEKYKLIRLRMDANIANYPRKEIDIYGWEFQYQTFEDHLARLFAHELHHFRRYHLNQHPNEGEQKANQWSLKYIQSLGFHVKGHRKIMKRKSPKSRFQSFFKHDPYKQFRNIKSGDQLRIKTDPHKKYKNTIVQVLRPIRSNSKRIVIQTLDGKQWRWPLDWLEI